jgi:hypothetical protein
MFLAYGVSLSAAVCFALFLLVPMFMGIVLNIKAKHIAPKERLGLLIWFFWPSFKYYAFR